MQLNTLVWKCFYLFLYGQIATVSISTVFFRKTNSWQLGHFPLSRYVFFWGGPVVGSSTAALFAINISVRVSVSLLFVQRMM